ncbi:MAG: hypothetical protein KGZ58_09600 [Ignavibacteriales bacterium]|nr:hypothetical protein [Ignavibacteriales bacterium]
MANLFWKQNKSKTLNLLSTPFKTEEEFEKVVFETKELFEDIYFIKRQIRGGGKAGIPDIIGIDTDGNVCIIEMKNVVVDSSIFPQILSYAIWAKENPDSIKSLWLEMEDQPDDITVNWDNYEVRMIVIAPSINPSTLKMVDSISYQIDFIEITRWIEKENYFLLVNKLEPIKQIKVKTAKGLQTYDEEFYKSRYNTKSVESFLKFAKETEKLIKQHNIPLEKKFNHNACAFKYGFFRPFRIKWTGTKTFAYTFWLSKSIAEKIQPKNIKMYRYYSAEAIYIIDEKTKPEDFLLLIKKSLEVLQKK